MIPLNRTSLKRVGTLPKSVSKSPSSHRQLSNDAASPTKPHLNHHLHSKSVSLYVHWPFCKSICPYCDFNRYLLPSDASDLGKTHQIHKEVQTSMRKALLMELKTNLEAYRLNTLPQQLNSPQHSTTPSVRPIVPSIFFGGGTPSLADVRDENHLQLNAQNSTFPWLLT